MLYGHSQIDRGHWSLVRRTTGNRYHPSNDSLNGTSVYGILGVDPKDKNSIFSTTWNYLVSTLEEIDRLQLLIATGDERMWVIVSVFELMQRYIK